MMTGDVTLVVSVTLPLGALGTLRNIGAEAGEYVAARARLAGFDPTVTVLVGEAEVAR